MNKIILLVIASLAFATAISVAIGQSNKNALSDLLLNNIEALANNNNPNDEGYPGDGGSGDRNKIKCYETVTGGSGTMEYVGYCGTCSAVKATDYHTQRTCYQ